MLVLTRKKDQKIIIGDKTITLTILDFNEHAVKIGIDAPREIPVHRQEIYRRIKDENDNIKLE